MATLDWSQCPAVESIPDKVGGAWVFRGTRLITRNGVRPLESTRPARHAGRAPRTVSSTAMGNGIQKR